MATDITNKVLEYRKALEMKCHYEMEYAKQLRYKKIKEAYYAKHPDAIRFYIPSQWAKRGGRNEC